MRIEFHETAWISCIYITVLVLQESSKREKPQVWPWQIPGETSPPKQTVQVNSVSVARFHGFHRAEMRSCLLQSTMTSLSLIFLRLSADLQKLLGIWHVSLAEWLQVLIGGSRRFAASHHSQTIEKMKTVKTCQNMSKPMGSKRTKQRRNGRMTMTIGWCNFLLRILLPIVKMGFRKAQISGNILAQPPTRGGPWRIDLGGVNKATSSSTSSAWELKSSLWHRLNNKYNKDQ